MAPDISFTNYILLKDTSIATLKFYFSEERTHQRGLRGEKELATGELVEALTDNTMYAKAHRPASARQIQNVAEYRIEDT